MWLVRVIGKPLASEPPQDFGHSLDEASFHGFYSSVRNIFAENGFETFDAEAMYGSHFLANRGGRSYAVYLSWIDDRANNVDTTAIHTAYAGARHYNCQQAVIVSNSGFSNSAHSLLEEYQCIAIESFNIMHMMDTL